MSDDEVVMRIQAKYSENPYNVDFEAIDEGHEKRLQDLLPDQAKVIGIGVLAWVGPSVVVYILGLAIGWIFRGFQKTPT